MFDFEAFFIRHNIPHITTGKVGRDDVGTPCPFCGNDQGYNLSVSKKGLGWYCWKRPREHRGRTPHRLIQALLHCSYAEADSIVGGGTGQSPVDQQLIELANVMMTGWGTNRPRAPTKLELPDEFRPIRDHGTTRVFVNYLRKRGFDDWQWLVDEFGLLCCTEGRFAGRVIIPIEMEHEVVSWTGRHVGSSPLRYDTLPVPPARMSNKNTLLFYDKIVYAGTLIVCEGPFDAARINYLARDLSIFATCVYGKDISDAQLDLLLSLECKRKIIMFDRETRDEAQEMNRKGVFALLGNNGFEFLYTPAGVKDPGELTEKSFKRLWNDSLLQK